MIDLFKNMFHEWLVYIRPSFLTLIPDDLKIQEICNGVVQIDPWLLYDVHDYLKTQEMCNEAIKKAPWLLFDVPDCFMDLRMSIRAILQPLILFFQNILKPRRCVKGSLKKTHGN